MKDKKIRILCIIAAALSVLAIIPIMFGFYKYYFTDGYFTEYGFELYADTKRWWYFLVGILGIISLLWNLVYGAYAIIDGRYRNLTWRIARYGYFYGIIVGIINFSVIISNCTNGLPLMWVFLVFVAAVVAVEIVLIILKDEDTKKQNG
ncbi:MAG: hypothetical protein K2N23_01550 [Clostridia bacterium]|nr:hypothetical protein [Clostridia bacterium]